MKSFLLASCGLAVAVGICVTCSVACSGAVVPAPSSDQNYDDPDDPGSGGSGTPEGNGKDGGTPVNPMDAGTIVMMPSGTGGIGFDDMRFSSALGKLIIPAGRTGDVDILDPTSLGVTAIGGFTTVSGYDGMHDVGTTSADVGNGVIFAVDQTNMMLGVVDPAKQTVLTKVALAGAPSLVRYVAPTNEVWVTEAAGIEIFSLDAANTPAHAALIKLAMAPDGLEIDATRGFAYTNVSPTMMAAITLAGRSTEDQWANGCVTAAGIALDVTKGIIFAACQEGTLQALDANNSGVGLSSATTAAGVDLIAYDAVHGRVYVPGTGSQQMTIVSVGANGALSVLGNMPIDIGAHCVVSDQNLNAFVCDPPDGELLVVHDPF